MTKPLMIAFGMALLATSPALAQKSDKIRIGFLSPLSGAFGILGAEQLRGTELALKTLDNKLGGVPVQFVKEDSKMTVETGQQAATKLIESDQVDVLVGNMMSNLLLAYVGPTTKQGKIILSGIAGPSKLAGEDCNPNVFVYSWENNSPSEVVGKLMTDAGMKKAFFLSQNFVTGREHAAGAKTFYKGEVVGEAYVPIAQVDYAGEIASIRASGADSVFVFLPGSAGIAFLKQFANSGLKDRVQLFSGSWLADELSFEAVGDAALKVNLVAPWFAGLDNPANKEFVAAFQSANGRKPVFYAAFIYDSIMALDAAIKTLGGDISDKSKLFAELKKANFTSTRGAFKLASNHFPIQNYYSATVVKRSDGKLEQQVSGTVVTNYQDRFGSACKMKS